MSALVIFLICDVTSTIIHSHIDQINNVSCTIEKPIAASRFYEQGVECLSPMDFLSYKRFSKAKSIDINIAVAVEFYYTNFEKYIYKDFQ